MDVRTVGADVLFRVFTACPLDPRTLILDVRPYKAFAKKHVMQAFSIRLAANGKALLDYSKNEYKMRWSADCWWNKPVIVYGDATLRKDHPVVAFLAQNNRAKCLHIYKDGFDALEKLYPFLCSPSVKANATKRFPSQLVEGLLYLGDWSHAQDQERLDEINVRRVVTLHNNPDNLKLPPRFKHLSITLADVDTEDISPYFARAFDFIEEARTAGHAVLVHCGAGVSRSAAVCIAYLMRRFSWSAHKARAYAVERRSLVAPNDGFWRSLCALEGQLGILDRSDPNAGTGGRGLDAPAQLAAGAGGEPVEVKVLPPQRPGGAGASSREQRAPGGTEAGTSGRGATDGAGDARAHQQGQAARRRSRSRNRDRSRDRGRGGEGSEQDRDGRDGRSRQRDSRQDGRRDGSRERSSDRHRRRSRDRSRDREAGPERSRDRGAGQERQEDKQRVSFEQDKQAPAAEEALGVILEVWKEGRQIQRLALGLERPGQRLVVGRVAACGLVLEHASISRQHAALEVDATGHPLLTDLGSAHHTNVDGVWIRPNVPRQLKQGSVIRFGGSSREYKVASYPALQPKQAAHPDE